MQDTITRIKAEFEEMPGLRLTTSQARRLCGVDEMICKAVLDALVDSGFLCVKGEGVYSRRTDGPVTRTQHPQRPPTAA